MEDPKEKEINKISLENARKRVKEIIWNALDKIEKEQRKEIKNL